MDVSPIKANQFSFNGFTYSLSHSNASMSMVEFADIYLDLNNSWTSDEIKSLYALLRDYNVYAYLEDAFVLMSPENWDNLTNELVSKNFSLFPFHHIEDTETSLIITKGRELSPYLRDFKTSAFAEGIGKYFASG